MNVYINGRFLSEPLTGVGRYSLEVVRAIDAMVGKGECEFKFFLIVSDDCGVALKNIKIIKKRIDSDFREQILLPFYTRDGYLINLSSRAPLLKKRQLLVIHDAHIVMCPEMYSFGYRFFWSMLYRIFGKTLHNIATVSNFSKELIHGCFKISRDKIRVTGEGYEHIFRYEKDDTVFEKFGIERKKYILLVGGSRNKNFELVMKAVRGNQFTDKVVIAGSIDDEYKTELEEYSQVNILGYVSNEMLVSLYANAKCFIFPSVMEGFGIPPLEAMALGCLTVVSNTSSMPEVCGKSVLYCNQNDSDGLLKLLQLIDTNYNSIYDEKLPMMKGNLKRFSWHKTAKCIIDTVKKDLDYK